MSSWLSALFNTLGAPRGACFSKLPRHKYDTKGVSQYYPIRLARSFSLNRLSSEKHFLKVLATKD